MSIIPENTKQKLSALATVSREMHKCRFLMGGAHTKPQPHVRVGIMFQELAGWAAQVPFVRMFANSLNSVAAQNGIELGIVSNRSPDGSSVVPATIPGARWFIPPTKAGECQIHKAVAYHKLDVVIALFAIPENRIDEAGVLTWIPDFQHFRLPHFFSEAENQLRDKNFRVRPEVSDFILLSSQSAHDDLKAFMPEASRLAAVAPFPSGLVFDVFPHGDPHDTIKKYHLAHKFLLVSNQFWVHKNHQVVLDALALLLKEGIRVHTVLTGLPSDYRDPTNSPTSQILQGIATRGLNGLVVPLGQIPFSDLVQLMRCAAVMVQPSRFEGWSTVVEDAKAIGRPLICSNISVHREQAPQALGFFDCDDPVKLAEILRLHWDKLSPGPDMVQESRAIETEMSFALAHGHLISSFCRRAFEVARLRRED